MTIETKKLAQKIKALLSQASVLAERYGQSELAPEHLLLVMLGQREGEVQQMLAKLSVPIDAVTDEVRRAMLRFPSSPGEIDLTVSQRLQYLLINARKEAEYCGDPSISVKHILQALLGLSQGDAGGEPSSASSCEVGDILLNYGVNREAVARFYAEDRSVRQRPQIKTPDEGPTIQQPAQIISPNETQGMRHTAQTVTADADFEIRQPSQTVALEDGSQMRERHQTLLQGFKMWKNSQELKADGDLKMWQTRQTEMPDEDLRIRQMQLTEIPDEDHGRCDTPQTPQTLQAATPVKDSGIQQTAQPATPNGSFIFRGERITLELEEKVKKALTQASVLASRHRQSEVEPEHLLLVILGQPKGVVPHILNSLSVPIDAVITEINRSIMRFPFSTGKINLSMSPRLRFLLMNAQVEAEQSGDPYIGGEHILLALVVSAKGKRGSKREAGSTYSRDAGGILLAWGVNQDTVLGVINEAREMQQKLSIATPDDDLGTEPAPQATTSDEEFGIEPMQQAATPEEDFGMLQTEPPNKAYEIRKTLQTETLNEIRRMWQSHQTVTLDRESMIWQTIREATSGAESRPVEDRIQQASQSAITDEDSWKHQVSQPAITIEDYLIWQTPQTAPNTESFFMPLDAEQTTGTIKGNVIISTHNLCKNFLTESRERQVLKNLDLDIYENDFTVIIGSPGAGKSTLLYTLSGMDRPTSGSICFLNEDISKLTYDELAVFRRRNCGFVFRQMFLLDNMSIMENILADNNLIDSSNSSIAARAKDLLTRVGLNEEIWRKFPAQLSNGENQRAAIVRALINKPKVIFADEPTGSLNSAAAKSVLDVLTDVNNNGQSVIMFTHDLNSAMRGNRILYIRDGAICGECALGKYMNTDQTRGERLQAFLAEMK